MNSQYISWLGEFLYRSFEKEMNLQYAGNSSRQICFICSFCFYVYICTSLLFYCMLVFVRNDKIKMVNQSICLMIMHRSPVLQRNHRPFFMRIHQSLVDSPHNGSVMQSFDVFCNDNLSNKQKRCCRFETP